MDLLDLEEKEFAKRLRKLCAPFGDERKSILCESTDILYQMGKLYTKKAAMTENGMDQKLNFIKAATLLHSARIRAENVLKMSWKTEEIHEAINEMESVLMEKCCGNVKNPLSELSLSALASFESWRSEEKLVLDSLEIIEEDQHKDETEKKFNKKIEAIKGLLKRNSDNYKKKLQEISREIFQYVGPPPCDFAIAGLGSLARDEVTLYSDFEHAIVLEEGVQNRENYVDSILEYFRWFSVVFHVIIIGIGETIIPSIGIETLNDLYSSDKSKNWFYDSFTPPGISFDGMMPHACKIPLGRQRKTKKKDFVVELIKPASEMALYLTVQEDIKNGYCLKDVLQETCFVFGSEEVYSMFKNISDKHLEMSKDKTNSSVSSAVKEDVTPYFSGVSSCLSNSRGYCVPVNPKVAFYRPLSLLISCLAKIRDTRCKSGFENLIEFHDTHISPYRNTFLQAFAIACETRLKGYSEEHSSRKKHFAKEIIKHIGSRCLSICVSAIISLSDSLRRRRCADEGLFDVTQFGKFGVLLLRDRLNDALHSNLVDSFVLVAELHKFWVDIFDAKKLFTPGDSQAEYDERYAPLENAENLCEKVKGRESYTNLCLLLSICYFYNGEFGKVKKYALAASEEIGGTFSKTLSTENFLHQTNMLFLSMESAEFIDYCKDCLSRTTSLVQRMFLGYFIATTQCGMGEKLEARISLKNVTKMSLTDLLKIDGDNFIFVMLLTQWCFLQQKDENWSDDAVETLDILDCMAESGRLYINPDDVASKQHSFYAAWAYLSAVTSECSIGDAISHYEKAFKNCKLREELDGYQQLYRFLIKTIIVDCHKRSDHIALISFLDKIFSEAPRCIKRNGKLQTVLVTYLLFWFRQLLTESDPLKTCHLATCYCRMMGILHPIFYPFVQRLVFLVGKRTKEMLSMPDKPCKLLGEVLSQSLDVECESHRYSENSCIVAFRKEMKMLWKCLCRKNKITGTECLNFLKHVHGFMCLDAHLRFNKMMEDLTNVHVPTRHRFLQKGFLNFVNLYKNLDLEKAIQKFWLCVNMKGSTYGFTKVSIVFLCNATLLHLFFNGGRKLFADPDKLQIIAVTHDDPDIGEEVVRKLWQHSDDPPKSLVVEDNTTSHSVLDKLRTTAESHEDDSIKKSTLKQLSGIDNGSPESAVFRESSEEDLMLMLRRTRKKYFHPETPPEILLPGYKLRKHLRNQLAALKRGGHLGLFSEPPQ